MAVTRSEVDAVARAVNVFGEMESVGLVRERDWVAVGGDRDRVGLADGARLLVRERVGELDAVATRLRVRVASVDVEGEVLSVGGEGEAEAVPADGEAERLRERDGVFDWVLGALWVALTMRERLIDRVADLPEALREWDAEGDGLGPLRDMETVSLQNG